MSKLLRLLVDELRALENDGTLTGGFRSLSNPVRDPRPDYAINSCANHGVCDNTSNTHCLNKAVCRRSDNSGTCRDDGACGSNVY